MQIAKAVDFAGGADALADPGIVTHVKHRPNGDHLLKIADGPPRFGS